MINLKYQQRSMPFFPNSTFDGISIDFIPSKRKETFQIIKSSLCSYNARLNHVFIINESLFQCLQHFDLMLRGSKY